MELVDWAGPGPEMGFKGNVQNVSSSVSAGITSNKSGQYCYFLTGARQQGTEELDIACKHLLTNGRKPTGKKIIDKVDMRTPWQIPT